MKHQSGFGLSELLVGLFLASIILTALIQFYLSNKRQYLAAEAILTERFDLQWVSDLLSNSIKRAGFTPCLGVDQLDVVDRRFFGRKVSSLKISNQPQQLIQVNRMSEQFTKLIRVQSPTELIISNSAPINEHHPLLIANCEHAEIHEILSIDNMGTRSLITLTKPLMFTYGASTYLGEWLEERWFIKRNGKGVDALYYQLHSAEELTSLIHSLYIKETYNQAQRYLNIILGLEQKKTLELLVAVRGT